MREMIPFSTLNQLNQHLLTTQLIATMSENVAHALSGAGGGMLAMVVTYPLITLSTRAQVEVKKVTIRKLPIILTSRYKQQHSTQSN